MASYSTSAVCSIQFSKSDRIRLNGIPSFPSELIDPIRSAIIASWSAGIQDEGAHYGAHEYKLKGNPWHGQGHESVHARSVLKEVLVKMASVGWNLIQSCDVSKKFKDKDTLFFEQAPPDPDTQMFAVSFNRSDRIRLIDSPSDMISDAFTSIVKQAWPYGVQHVKNYEGSLEIKLSGNPWWTSNGGESMAAKQLLCYILAELRTCGFKLYASVDISQGHGQGQGNSGGVGDLESWVFRKISPVWN